MAIEDALFRAIVPSAEALWAERRKAGTAIDCEALARQALAPFGEVVDLTQHAPALCARLQAYLEQLGKER